MFSNRLSILWKITLLAGFCLLAVVTLLVGHAVYRMNADTSFAKTSVAQMLETSARERMKKEANVQALTINNYMMPSYQEGLSFSRQVVQQRRQAHALKLSPQALRENLHYQVKQVLEVNPQPSSGMQQQYREVDQVATASQEMTASAHEVARSAAHAADAAQGANLGTLEGLEVVNNTSTAIEHLSHEMSAAMEEIQDLTSRSDQISSVLDVIRAIAEQTNLLVLNAAIEAARAGDAGRGFAVAADEVRNLARRTQSSVREVRSVIEGLQQRTWDVVNSMHSSHSKAQSSVGQVALAVAALQRIGASISIITHMNLQIASAAEEQSIVVEEINRNVSQLFAILPNRSLRRRMNRRK